MGNRDRRFELSRLGLAGVAVGMTAALFVVFLLGVYAGRGMTERRLEGERDVVQLPVSPAVEQTPDPDRALTFYDTLGGGTGAERTGEAAGRARPADAPPAGGPAPRAEAPAPGAGGPPGATEPRADEPPPAGRPDPQRPAVPNLARSPDARVALALVDPPTPVPSPQMRGEWTVQVAATRDPATADRIVRQLRAKGYDAYVVTMRRQGQTFHRVRVGRYPSLESANHAVARLRREPGVPEAFVASD
jgi:cell division septation protein DedD